LCFQWYTSAASIAAGDVLQMIVQWRSQSRCMGTAIIVRDRYSWKRSSPLLHHAIDVTQQLRRWKCQ
jgi:hypothetical protein